jgi:hypothetical protein
LLADDPHELVNRVDGRLWRLAEDPMMSKLAEVSAAAFSSGLSWQGAIGGKQVYCPPAGLKGGEAMIAFERFLADHPEMAV